MTLRKADIGYVDDADPGEPTTLRPRVSISDGEAAILSGLAAGRNCFEIGTGLGVSTRALGRWGHIIVTHDIDSWVHENIWPGLVAENRKVHPTAQRLDPSWWSVSLVFIDGDHSTPAVVDDIEFARSLRPDLIVCHDAKYANVRRAFPDWEDWLFLDTEHGLAIGPGEQY